MALNCILRRAVISFHHAIIPAGKHNFSSKHLTPSFLLRSYSYSSSVAPPLNNAHPDLLQVVDSEIKCAEEDLQNRLGDQSLDDFPFEMKDFPGAGTLTLIRKYENETIKLEVDMPRLLCATVKNEAGESDEKVWKEISSVPVSVIISKDDKVLLDFKVYGYRDKITIRDFRMRAPDSPRDRVGYRYSPQDRLGYRGRYFEDLDLNLQKELHKYLEIRGIKPSLTNFLHEYMINKDTRQHLLWLNDLKTFLHI